MLSLRELRRAVAALDDERSGAHLERVVQLDTHTLVLELSGGKGIAGRDRFSLLLCCRPGHARLGAPAEVPKAPERPLPFAQFLRPRLAGSRLVRAGIRNEDRQGSLVFEGREGRYEVLLSLIGPRSNLYLLDERGHLLRTARPLADTRRDLEVGAPWSDPASRPPPEGEDRFADVADSKLLAAIESHYAGQEVGEHEERVKRRLSRAFSKARAALERKVARLEGDAASAEQAPALERLGELLKANLARVGRGDGELEVQAFDGGETVVIPLDPTKSAAANLEDLFRRARKAARRGLRAATELGGLAVRLEELDALARDLEAADSEAARAAFSERPEVERILKRFAPESTAGKAESTPKKTWKIGKRELPTRLVPKRYRTSDGLEIWVGKNDEGNDVLTTRLARGRDLFLHLEGSPGSHVILRTDKGDEPPRESLLEAAELAVHFSKHRKVTRAAVHVAAIKDVSKPKGAKPGLVWVHRGRNIQLKRSPQRLERILTARIDD